VNHTGHRRSEVGLANPLVLEVGAASVDRACSDLMIRPTVGGDGPFDLPDPGLSS
jgi:hypothetical protein